MLMHPERSQLILIDYQARLMPAIADGYAVLARARRLAQLANWLDIPIRGTQQTPAKLGPMDETLAHHCLQLADKSSFSAAQVLLPLLGSPSERKTLVIAGCETHVCLLQTVLDLKQRGWDLRVVVDASGSRHAVDRDTALARMAAAGCECVTSEMVGFEWLGDASHPQFRAWQRLIK